MNTHHSPQHEYALCRGLGCWQITFAGQQTIIKHEMGMLYVGCLLLHPPREPIHAVVLALKAREACSGDDATFPILQQRSLGLDEAERVRRLLRLQRELEAILEDNTQIEPVKAEARRELEAITDHLRTTPWRGRGTAEHCAEAVGRAINRLHARLAAAVDAQGRPHPVLRAFAEHLREHLLIPSGRGFGRGGRRPPWAVPGCFTYEPPQGVVWTR